MQTLKNIVLGLVLITGLSATAQSAPPGLASIAFTDTAVSSVIKTQKTKPLRANATEVAILPMTDVENNGRLGMLFLSANTDTHESGLYFWNGSEKGWTRFSDEIQNVSPRRSVIPRHINSDIIAAVGGE